MGYSNLYASSALQCKDLNCVQRFLDRPALVPKMGSAGGSFGGRVFIVVSVNYAFLSLVTCY